MRKHNYRFTLDKFGAHQRIIIWVESGKKVLEVGCALGYMSKEFSQKGCLVTGIEINPEMAKEAKKHCHKVVIGDVESQLDMRQLRRKKFEVIVLADVLEHLKKPESTLKNLVGLLEKEGKVIISVPNIGFLTNRLLHLLGRFDYADWGIMDRGHLRFFTKKSIVELVGNTGLILEKLDYVANFTQLPFYMQTLYLILGERFWWRRLEYKITGFWPEGLAVQFLLLCRKK